MHKRVSKVHTPFVSGRHGQSNKWKIKATKNKILQPDLCYSYFTTSLFCSNDSTNVATDKTPRGYVTIVDL